MPIRQTAPSQCVRRELTVVNKLGLHARPAAEFVKQIRLFRSTVTIIMPDGQRRDASRLMELLLANLDCGATFTFEAEGPDAAETVDRVERLLREFKEAEDRGEMS